MKVTMPWSWAVQNSLNLNGVKIESSCPFYYGIVPLKLSLLPLFLDSLFWEICFSLLINIFSKKEMTGMFSICLTLGIQIIRNTHILKIFAAPLFFLQIWLLFTNLYCCVAKLKRLYVKQRWIWCWSWICHFHTQPNTFIKTIFKTLL